jgi:hypothetical protein
MGWMFSMAYKCSVFFTLILGDSSPYEKFAEGQTSKARRPFLGRTRLLVIGHICFDPLCIHLKKMRHGTSILPAKKHDLSLSQSIPGPFHFDLIQPAVRP